MRFGSRTAALRYKKMMKKYSQLEIKIVLFTDEDVVRTSQEGTVDGDETKYPVPGGWAE